MKQRNQVMHTKKPKSEDSGLIANSLAKGRRSEADRLNFLINRDGLESAKQWACFTYKLYRKAVTNKAHFASKKGYRKKFIRSYCELKSFCSQVRKERDLLGDQAENSL